MQRHPKTAVMLTCSTCGLVRIADDYASAHARGKAHSQLSRHQDIKYSLIEAPERLKDAELAAKESMETMAQAAGMNNISTEAEVRQVAGDVSTRR